MVVQYEKLENGLTRAYSDSNFKIRGGEPVSEYDEAFDPSDLNRQYEETDILTTEAQQLAEQADYLKALQDLGVNING